jgi:hypothetical protein
MAIETSLPRKGFDVKRGRPHIGGAQHICMNPELALRPASRQSNLSSVEGALALTSTATLSAP